jgi:hypothetical protein
MIWHYHDCVQVEHAVVFLQAAFKNNLSGFGRKSPAVVSSEGDEDWPIVFLNVGEPAAVIILRLHKTVALWAA